MASHFENKTEVCLHRTPLKGYKNLKNGKIWSSSIGIFTIYKNRFSINALLKKK